MKSLQCHFWCEYKATGTLILLLMGMHNITDSIEDGMAVSYNFILFFALVNCFLNWKIIALQCCVGFCHIAICISCKYIPSLLSVSYNFKHNLATHFSNHIPRDLCNWFENLYPCNYLHTNFVEALVIITNNWKQTRCFSVGEWIKKTSASIQWIEWRML